ncbi:hypothetical protein GA0115245_12004 [Streptomyces sp. di188]|nr:hypothetical protein GA0115245_12004 [Streptomyces sp. di188]
MTATPASRVRAPRPTRPPHPVSPTAETPAVAPPVPTFARTHSARTDFARTEEPRP